MNVLALDTATNVLHLALQTDNSFEERVIINQDKHSDGLLAEIDNILKRNKISVKDLDLLVCTRGPGAFTSLRIGMSVLKGLSSGADIPLVSVPTLETLAKAIFAPKALIVPVIDARKDRYYLGFYQGGAKLADDMDGNAENIVDFVKDYPFIVLTGPDCEKFKYDLEPLLDGQTLLVDDNPTRSHGKALLELGKKYYKEVGEDDIGQGPMYIRRSDAEEALIKRNS